MRSMGTRIAFGTALCAGLMLVSVADSESKPGQGVPFAGLQTQIVALEAMVEEVGAVVAESVLRAWDRKIADGSERFVVLDDFAGQAVLDRETQIVWQRTPDGTKRDWVTALSACFNAQIAGRGGWRVPQMEEITSVVDRTVSNPPIPPGHPFDLSNVTGDVWSATTVPDTDTAWTQDVRNDGFLGGFSKDDKLNVWCVRGGRGIEGQ